MVPFACLTIGTDFQLGHLMIFICLENRLVSYGDLRVYSKRGCEDVRA